MFNMNFGNIFGETNKYKVQIWVGDAIVQNDTIEMPAMVAQQQIFQIFNQVMQNPSPMKLKVSTTCYNQDGEEYEDFVEVMNPLMTNAQKDN